MLTLFVTVDSPSSPPCSGEELSSSSTASEEISFGSEKELAEKAVEVINRTEQETQTSLHEIIGNAHIATLKELRKASTVHKVKMQWNKNTVKMVSQLTKQGK